MGDVIYVKFGPDRSWDGMRKVIEEGLSETILSCVPNHAEREFRASVVAENTIQLMKTLEPHLTFQVQPSITIPAGIRTDIAEALVRETVRQVGEQVQEHVGKLKEAAHIAIASAATSTVTALLYRPTV